ncbi:MAG: PKD domain-containing protein [Bacteroidia bacterium]
MKKLLPYFFVAVGYILNAQTSRNAAVELWAQVQTSPPTVTLNWLPMAGATNYAVAKKTKTAGAWTTIAGTIPGTVNTFVDNSVTAGGDYEYRVFRTAPSLTYGGYGYIHVGIESPAIENRGKLILLVADNFSVSLAAEISRLEEDMEGDGWDVITAYTSTAGTVPSVRAQIQAIYNQDPANTKALFILGHVPVPYSGDFGPDAHTNHQGAWPADTYYGDMDGTWTDATINVTTGLPARTQNIPGDGKFDQNTVPGNGVELQVGRVDLYAMPAFTLTETQLTKNYLDKDHDYRKKNFSVQKRGVVDDNFGYFSGEAFASSGYKNFAPLVDPNNVIAADYLTTLNANDYLWSYGCGGGSYTSASGIGNTTNFTTSNTQGVFTVLFGSYFGDWDISNNFLKAPLCQGKTLTNFWSGRPHWAIHHMGLGENIGYGAKVTQNNVGLYYFSYAQKYIGISLMGDPTLRNDIVSPVSNVVATRIGNDCHITWSASTQTNVLGYNLYMKNDTNKTYTKINSSLISGTTYTDPCMVYPGTYKYMVRALVLEDVPSGKYYNMSEGIMDTALNNINLAIYATAGAIYSGTSSAVSFTCQNTGGTGFNWNFGDGNNSNQQNPNHTYTVNGNYTATLVITNGCNSKTLTVPVGITTDVNDTELTELSNVYPNPNNGQFKLSLYNPSYESIEVSIFDMTGKMLGNEIIAGTEVDLTIGNSKKGLYLIKARYLNSDRVITKRVIIE